MANFAGCCLLTKTLETSLFETHFDCVGQLSVNKIGAFSFAQNPDVCIVNKNTLRHGVQALTTLRPPTIFIK